MEWPPLALVAHHAPWLLPLVGAVMGAVAGSLANCLAYRLPRGLSPWRPPSHCPACAMRLGVIDLVPVLSYLGLRGRCRGCGSPIPIASLGVEVAGAAVGVGLAVAFQTCGLVGWWLWPLLASSLGVYVAGVVAWHGYRPWPMPHRGQPKPRPKAHRL